MNTQRSAMKRRLIETIIVASGVLIACSESAWAQYRSAAINRPSEQTGSSILGRVGGTYTRGYGNTASPYNRGSTTLGGAGNNLGRPNFFGAGWQMGELPSPTLPQAFTYSAPGARIPMTISPWAAVLAGVQASELNYITGMQYATDVNTPLSNQMPVGFPMPNSPYFAPAPPSNTLQQFFGLAPAIAAEEAPAIPPDVSWTWLLERENENELQAKKAQALRLFKQVTQKTIDGQEELLSQTQRSLQQVAVADPQDSLSCLLLVHISMERNQLLSAAVNLQDAVARNPEVFAQPCNLGQYFGDPEVLLARAREMVRIGDENPDPINYALQGYSAWLLNDRPRLAETMTHMREDAIASKMTPKAKAVQYALSAAVR
jgi:hypothetical protein